jgi:hypothetical protein
MEHPSGHPPVPACYYRRHAARVRASIRDVTTPALKQHLNEVALEYERLAERIEEKIPSAVDGSASD